MSNEKWSEYDEAGPLVGDEILPLVQDGVNVRTTPDDLIDVLRFAPLAIAAQSPPQEPVQPSGTVGNVGSLPIAARADHLHPIPAGIGSTNVMFGYPPLYGYDIVADGTFVGPGNGAIYRYQDTNFSPIFSIAGSVIKSLTSAVQCRNFTLNSGKTLTGNGPGTGLLILCSGTCTINGTVDVSGESPAAGAAPAQAALTGANWAGAPGATGAVGAGVSGPGSQSTYYAVGGDAGSGGTAGANTGGFRGAGWTGTLAPGIDAWLYQFGNLAGFRQTSTSIGPANGGGGGGSGGGDNSNKGGSGGGGGGVLTIIAKNIVISSTGSLKSNGGAGAPGQAGNAAGGGGGGSGLVALHTASLSIDPSAVFQAAGGAAGAGVGTGAAGGAGGQSNFYDPPVPPTSYGYGYGFGFLINVWV